MDNTFDDLDGNTEVRVVAALIRRGNGDVLLTQRDPGRTQSPTYEFPGGKVEQDEDDVAALKRELSEELGLQVEVKQPWVFQTKNTLGKRSVHLRIYRCLLKEGAEPKARDIKYFDWVPTNEILHKKISDASMLFVRELHQGNVPNESKENEEKEAEAEVDFTPAKVLRVIDVSKYVHAKGK